MRSVRGYATPDARAGAVIALGNFDGVHRGHRAVVARTAELAHALDAPLGVALFDPHPRRFFAPDSPAFRLMSERQRDETLAGLGVSVVHTLPFDATMAAMTPQQFVDDVLVSGLGIRGVVTGPDFRFGANRAGGIGELDALCAAHGVETAHVALHGEADEKVSSTRVRNAIRHGHMDEAAGLLGQTWSIDGVVQPGDQRGRTIGFPTANIDLGDFLRPAYGVYAVEIGVLDTGARFGGVANIGKRPTVDGLRELLEVHLFDFDGDLYGKTLSVGFRVYLRPEQKFDGLDALKAQIASDADAARAVLSTAAGPA